MRQLLLLFVIHGVLKSVECVNGVIWDRQSGNFVPIFSIPSFAALREEILRKSLEMETHNFQGEIVRFSYYEIRNMVTFDANGTEVGGALGELWTTLSRYLNFTLKPILSDYLTSGYKLPNGTYVNGLLNSIQSNETDVIPRVTLHHSNQLVAAQFSMPLWRSKNHLYIRRELKFLSTWMLRLFSPKVWYSILWMYLLLSVCSYVSQKTEIILTRRDLIVKFNDHLFYNFGTIVGQTYPWECVSKSAKIVNLWLTTFGFLIRSAFSAIILNYIWRTTVTRPFEDLHSLVEDTSYNIVTLSSSLADILYWNSKSDYAKVMNQNRYIVADTIEELYSLGCSKEKQWAVYVPTDLKKASGMIGCRLNPSGKHLSESYVVSGIAPNFKYKRAIDKGIIKLHEIGLIKELQLYWLEWNNEEEGDSHRLAQIDVDEVYIIIWIFLAGLMLAVVILLLENLIFYCNKRN